MKVKYLLSILSALSLSCAVNAQYVGPYFVNHTIEVYANKARPIAAKGDGYKVSAKTYQVENGKGSYTEWQKVNTNSTITLMFGEFPVNTNYKLKIESPDGDTVMIINSNDRLSNIPFRPGEYTIPHDYCRLFDIEPYSGVSITNQDISNFIEGKKLNYPNTRVFNLKSKNMWVTALNSSKRAAIFSSTQGIIAISKMPYTNWEQKELQVENIYGVYDLDASHYYVTANTNESSRYMNELLVFNIDKDEPTVINLDLDTLYKPIYIKMQDVNTIYTICRSIKAPIKYIVFTSNDGGYSWNRKLEGLKLKTNYGYANTEVFSHNDKIIALGSREQIIAYDPNGNLVEPSTKDFDKDNDKQIALFNNFSRLMFIKNNGVVFKTYTAWHGIQGQSIQFNGKTGVILNHTYFLITHDDGRTWTYYPYLKRDEDESAFQHIDDSTIRSGILLPNNILLVSNFNDVYSIDINKL